MMLSHSLRSPAKDQDLVGSKLSDKRETVKGPVNPMDFSTLVKKARSGLLLEKASGSLHNGEA